MEEYEVGQVYPFEGRLYRYNGGNPNDRSSWTEVSPASPEPKRSLPSIREILRLGAQGATFGFADELAGLVPGWSAETSRQRVDDIRREHPVASTISEVAGGAAVPLLGGASIGRSAVGATGSRLGGGIVGGAVGGLLGGALSGIGEGEGVGGRTAGGVVGGTVGAVTGGAVGATGGLLGRALTRFGASRAEVDEFARQRLQRALETAGVDPSIMAQRVAALGPGSVLADLSENLGREARAAVNQAPELTVPGGPVSRIRARQADRGDRIAQELRTASRLPKTFDESLAEAEEALQSVRQAFYAPLEDQYPVVDGPAVAAALQDPGIARIARRVIPGNRPPSFRELQDIMMDLRDEMTAARASGRPNASMRAAERFERLIQAMREDIPEFGPAQAAYRVAQKRIDAHELGRSFAFQDPRSIRNEISKLPEEARDAFRMGMLDRWEQALRETPTGGQRARSMIEGGQTVLDRIRLITADDAAFDELLKGLEREARWSETYRALRGNSTSAQQLSDMLEQVPRSMSQAAWQFASSIFGLTPAQRVAVAQTIGEVLLSEGEEAARRFTNQLALRYSLSGAVGAATGTTAAQRLIGGPLGPRPEP